MAGVDQWMSPQECVGVEQSYLYTAVLTGTAKALDRQGSIEGIKQGKYLDVDTQLPALGCKQVIAEKTQIQK